MSVEAAAMTAPTAHSSSSGIALAVWRAAGIPDPVCEHRFDSKRKWRLDFAWVQAKVGLECDGGVFSGGRHVRGVGYLRDVEKLNAATLAGWKVIRCVPSTLTSTATIEMIKMLLGQPAISRLS